MWYQDFVVQKYLAIRCTSISALTFQSRKEFSWKKPCALQPRNYGKFSLNILLHFSLPKFVTMYFVVFDSQNLWKILSLLDSHGLSGYLSMNIPGHHNLFCFNRSPKDDDTTSTRPLYLFLLDSCQVKLFLSPLLLISPW